MRPYYDPSWPDYRTHWQSKFSLRRKKAGIYSAAHAQRYISIVRVMKRHARAGKKPSIDCCPSFTKTLSGFFLHRRETDRLKRAIERGESSRSLALRGYFGRPLGRL
jgi:hypothetical protein